MELHVMSSYENTEAEILRSKLIETHRETSIEDYFKGEECCLLYTSRCV